MDFSDALRSLKLGARIARSGWNSKGMWLTLSPGGEVDSDKLWAPANKAFAIQNGGSARVLPYITMKTADNCIVPWLASQTDVLAADWVIVE
jgi:hypothetical protein